jgi:pilus assembly protein Flp/PilA
MFDSITRFYIMTITGIRNATQPRDETGATAVEYGLLVGLIAAAIVVTVGLLATKLNGIFTDVSSKI